MGCWAAHWDFSCVAGLPVARARRTASIPRLHEITLDPTVLVFTLVLSLVSALLFGSIPGDQVGGRRLALDASRPAGAGSSDSRERHRARNILVVVQVALALILLVGSGLMVRTFLALRAVHLASPTRTTCSWCASPSRRRRSPIPRGSCDCSARCSNDSRRSRA